MGHSITVYKNKKQITGLSFGATNHIKAAYVYKVLEAEDFNNGVSGNGISRLYRLEDIVTAKAALAYYEKEPFEVVRDSKKEQQAKSFIADIISSGDASHAVSGEEISKEIFEIKIFLDEILKAAPFSEVMIYFD
jgi:hypothetical protein